MSAEHPPTYFRGIDPSHFYHKVQLPDGTTTPGVCHPVAQADAYLLKDYDFSNKTVLDVATWSGGWAFYAESRGAKKVTGMDRVACRYGDTQAFDLIKAELKSNVEYKEGNIYNLWQLVPQGSYTTVFCFGLLYHLTDPLFALRNCTHAATEDIFIETVVRDVPEPYLELLPPRCFFGDPTNVYSPTTGWLLETMKYLGWSCVKKRLTASGPISSTSSDPYTPKGLCRVAMHFVPTPTPPNTWQWTTMPHPMIF